MDAAATAYFILQVGQLVEGYYASDKRGHSRSIEGVASADAVTKRREHFERLSDASGSRYKPGTKLNPCDRYRPEDQLFKKNKHGLLWPDAAAFDRAEKLGKAQGRFTIDTLLYANTAAQIMTAGTEDAFPLPEGLTAPVFMPDGTILSADYVFIKVRKSGVWHGYPRIGRGKIRGQ